MSKQILSPCPFCGGPPVPFTKEIPEGGITDSDLNDGVFIESYVFCHECGSQGPVNNELVTGREDIQAVEQNAVALWQERNSRNKELYESNQS